MPTYRSALDNGIERLFHYQKYRSEFLEATIKQGIVRFGRASEFNDPWDCKPSFHLPDDECELRRLVDFMQRASERHTPEVDPAYRNARAEQYLARPDQLRRDIADASSLNVGADGSALSSVLSQHKAGLSAYVGALR
jgi:hypothetical protein